MSRRFLCCLLGLMPCATLMAQEPEVTFVRSQLTERHIAVQPMTGFHRVYTVVRFRNCPNRDAFARVRCMPEGLEEKTVVTHRFHVDSGNELWAIYFHIPRYEQRTATYQVEYGEIDPERLNDHVIHTSFGWQVRRENGQPAEFVHDLGNGKAVGIFVPRRTANIVGGEIQLGYGYAAGQFTPVPLEYGFTNAGRNVRPDGQDFARRVNN